jgi:hypothetical protein
MASGFEPNQGLREAPQEAKALPLDTERLTQAFKK